MCQENKNVRISKGNGYDVAPSKFDGIMMFSNDLRNELIENTKQWV